VTLAGVDTDAIGLGDHLDVVGAAPAHPAVGHADDGDTARCAVAIAARAA
jgi:hypothetical protein